MVDDCLDIHPNKVVAHKLQFIVMALIFILGIIALDWVLGSDTSVGATYGKRLGIATGMIGIGLFFMIFIILETYHFAPSHIIYSEKGIQLKFRFNQDKFILWNELNTIEAKVQERSIIPWNPRLSGKVWLKKKQGRTPIYFLVSYENANKIISHFIGDPISEVPSTSNAENYLLIGGDERPSDNLAYGVGCWVVASMLSMGAVLLNVVPGGKNSNTQIILLVSTVVLASYGISFFRKGFHAQRASVFEIKQVNVPTSIFERAVGKKNIISTDELASFNVLRNCILRTDPFELDDPIYFGMLVTKDGNIYSIGPRNRSSLCRISAFVKNELELPIKFD
jgi:hypothetical protein